MQQALLVAAAVTTLLVAINVAIDFKPFRWVFRRLVHEPVLKAMDDRIDTRLEPYMVANAAALKRIESEVTYNSGSSVKDIVKEAREEARATRMDITAQVEHLSSLVQIQGDQMGEMATKVAFLDVRVAQVHLETQNALSSVNEELSDLRPAYVVLAREIGMIERRVYSITEPRDPRSRERATDGIEPPPSAQHLSPRPGYAYHGPASPAPYPHLPRVEPPPPTPSPSDP